MYFQYEIRSPWILFLPLVPKLGKEKNLIKAGVCGLWTTKEEEVLVQALKDAAQSGFKSDNGFRAGYLVFLEDAMKKVFPMTDLRGIPHINSKIHVWKRTHGFFLQTMLSRSGIGWNETEKMIEASSEAWEDFVKMDNSVRTMRYKTWPLYNDWCEIFGYDRASGNHVRDFPDAVQGVLKMPTDIVPDLKQGLDEIFRVVEGTSESISASNAPSLSASGNKHVSRKRKNQQEFEDTFVDAIKEFIQMSRCTMTDLVKRIGVEYDQVNAEKDVFEALRRVVELSRAERISVASLLVDRPKQLTLFYTLPEEERFDFLRNLLTDF